MPLWLYVIQSAVNIRCSELALELDVHFCLADMAGLSVHWISCGQPLIEPVSWKVKLCLLTKHELVLFDKAEVGASYDIRTLGIGSL